MPDDRVVAGKYRLIANLNKGGMGSVWRAEHLELNCPAAVKLLDPALAESPAALSRFRREAQAAASLRSSNIVQILDFGVDDGVPYIAMELLKGQSLADRLAAMGHLGPRETAIILNQVARAVSWTHSMGVVHRDLKPGNIFIADDAGEPVVKLLDFGIAKIAVMTPDDAPLTLSGTIMGTPQYMSPEQASCKGPVDHRTDIWSFGVVAYECLTGLNAFSGETLASVIFAVCSDPLPVPSQFARVPPKFDAWFARCTRRDPVERFQSISEAADSLRSICGLEIGELSRLSLETASTLPSAPPPLLRLGPMNGSIEASSATGAPSIVSLEAAGAPRRKSSTFSLLIGLCVAVGGAVALTRWGSLSGQTANQRTEPIGVSDSRKASDEARIVHKQAYAARPSAVSVSPTEAALPKNIALTASTTPPPPQQNKPPSRATVPSAPKTLSPAPKDSAAMPSQRKQDAHPNTAPSAEPEREKTVESVFGLRKKPPPTGPQRNEETTK